MGKNNSEAPGGPWGGLRHLGAALKRSEAGEVWAPRLGFVGLLPAFPLFATTPDNQIRQWQEISRGISPKCLKVNISSRSSGLQR